jgi:type IV pilus assembly protein PilN
MYSLDVNFLKDRHIETAKSAKSSKPALASFDDNLPLIIGGSVLAILPLLVGGLLLFINFEQGKTQENIQALDAQLNTFKAQNQRLADAQNKTKTIEEDLKSLVGIFEQIKPWSALLKEISRQIPPLVTIDSITQDKQNLILAGQAIDYGNVNEFLLNLQNSKFFKTEPTQLVSATLIERPISIDKKPDKVKITFPKVVSFSVKTELSDIPSSNLQSELRNNGAVGLLSRIQTLQQKGLLKP